MRLCFLGFRAWTSCSFVVGSISQVHVPPPDARGSIPWFGSQRLRRLAAVSWAVVATKKNNVFHIVCPGSFVGSFACNALLLLLFAVGAFCKARSVFTYLWMCVTSSPAFNDSSRDCLLLITHDIENIAFQAHFFVCLPASPAVSCGCIYAKRFGCVSLRPGCMV